MAKRINIFLASAPRMFASSLFYFGVCLMSLSMVLMVLGAPRTNSPLWLLLLVPIVPLTGYMAIGSFINACRRTADWFAVFFKWRNS